MPVVVIDPPEALLDLPTVRAHLRLDDDDIDNDLILGAYMAAAQAAIDGPGGWLGRCIGKQTLELRLNGMVDASGAILTDTIALPYPPLIGVTSFTYQDANGVDTMLAPAGFTSVGGSIIAPYGTVFPSGRFAPEAVRIRYTAGYDTVPPAIVAALLLMVGDLFANRATTIDGRASGAAAVPMSLTVEALLSPFRVFA